MNQCNRKSLHTYIVLPILIPLLQYYLTPVKFI